MTGMSPSESSRLHTADESPSKFGGIASRPSVSMNPVRPSRRMAAKPSTNGPAHSNLKGVINVPSRRTYAYFEFGPRTDMMPSGSPAQSPPSSRRSTVPSASITAHRASSYTTARPWEKPHAIRNRGGIAQRPSLSMKPHNPFIFTGPRSSSKRPTSANTSDVIGVPDCRIYVHPPATSTAATPS